MNDNRAPELPPVPQGSGAGMRRALLLWPGKALLIGLSFLPGGPGRGLRHLAQAVPAAFAASLLVWAAALFFLVALLRQLFAGS